MFLAFPLDFQTKDIISQVVGHFGTVFTWTNNSRCRSRVLVRCNVTLVSRIPRSVLVCEANAFGNNGSSWTVSVFVLNSGQNDELPADEEQVPVNGNPHPQNDNLQDNFQGHFEDVGDLNEVQQANVNHGWAAPQPFVQAQNQQNMEGWSSGQNRKGQ